MIEETSKSWKKAETDCPKMVTMKRPPFRRRTVLWLGVCHLLLVHSVFGIRLDDNVASVDSNFGEI